MTRLASRVFTKDLTLPLQPQGAGKGADREAFDAGPKAVLDEVRVSLDLGALNAFVHRWWISACDSVKDPEGRRMHPSRTGSGRRARTT
ncbi:DUF6247 family protein [Streptosporangium canum]|uniref:DUF6247 family protein n=1 Tax=Streptosporangium canum TaxID=324952 RepID=UPI000B862470